MEITLNPELEQFVKEKIERGQYHSVDEAVNEALRLLVNQNHNIIGITQTSGVCGGDACIGNTRIPVWSLVNDRSLEMSNAQILAAFPELSAADLVNAWAYAEVHSEEIEAAIGENEEIMQQQL